MVAAEDIQVYVATRAQEAQRLEFKGAASLAQTDPAKKEIVKDVSGMANADGGRIVYGITEHREHGSTFAGSIDPIRDESITRDWLVQVIVDNTGPPLSDFEVNEVLAAGGRVLVVDVASGSTAHQSSRDRLYYQRQGTQTKPMWDYQIRDVMARRHRPIVDFDLNRRAITTDAALHEYIFTPKITNAGNVTLADGWLDVEFPRPLSPTPQDAPGGTRTWARSNARIDRVVYERYGVPLPILHPEQQVTLDLTSGYSGLWLTVTDETWGRIESLSPPVRWHIYARNAQPLRGEVPFETWCSY
jgi:hypothetical protein